MVFPLAACVGTGTQSGGGGDAQSDTGAMTDGGVGAATDGGIDSDDEESDGVAVPDENGFAGQNRNGDDNTGAFSFEEAVIDAQTGKIVFGIDEDASDFETGILQLSIRNESKQAIETGRAYSIERNEGTWTTLPINVGWTDDALIIPPGERTTMNIDLCYGQCAYKRGVYRIDKSDTRLGSAFIEFTVKRDIRYDEDKMFSLLNLDDAVITYWGFGEYRLTGADERETDLMTIINDTRSARLAVPDTEAYLQENQFLDAFEIRVPRYNIETGGNDANVTQLIIYERRSKQDLLHFQVYREDWGETDLYDLAHEEVYAASDEYAIQYLRDLLERIKKATST
jgi:hypothetical protein